MLADGQMIRVHVGEAGSFIFVASEEALGLGLQFEPQQTSISIHPMHAHTWTSC